MVRLPVQPLLLVTALLALLAPDAQAVIIASGNRASNTFPPFSGPGWQNVTGRGEGSAVYLGDRWMLTARHVGAGTVNFNNREFTVRAGSGRQLRNPGDSATSGLTQLTDLLMFQLNEDPGLPSMAIGDTSPALGSRVTMVGRGANRLDEPWGWDVSSLPGGALRWSPSSMFMANSFGFGLAADRVIRWGINTVDSDLEFFDNDNVVVVEGTSGDVLAFSTTFHRGAFPDEAQAVEGDSGGGVFSYTSEGWELTGIMTSTKNLPNQPFDTVVFGDQTYAADLAFYRGRIEEVMGAPDTQNGANPADVNNDGTVTALDALTVINDLNANGVHAIVVGPTDSMGPFFDVNGDGFVMPVDVLGVINRLPSGTSSQSTPLVASNLSASAAATPVPEPATWLLAVCGAAGIWAARRWMAA